MAELFQFDTFEEQTFWEWIFTKKNDNSLGKTVRKILKSAVKNKDGTYSVNLQTEDEKKDFSQLSEVWEREEYVKEQIFIQMESPSEYTN